MDKEKSVIGIKFHKEIESAETAGSPILTASVENFGFGEKIYPDRLVDPQVLKLFREQCEHVETYNLIEAIFLGDYHIYKDTLKCKADFIIANPSIREDLEKLIIDNGLIDKTRLYSNLVGANEIICIHSDELMFPAHLESNSVVKMDNPCLVKIITFSKDLPEEFKFSKTYTITSAHKETIKALDCLLETIQMYGSIGHSGYVALFIDGDGACHIKVDGCDSNSLSKAIVSPEYLKQKVRDIFKEDDSAYTYVFNKNNDAKIKIYKKHDNIDENIKFCGIDALIDLG